MKKIIIILAVILTSGLTALSLNRKDIKSTEIAKVHIEKGASATQDTNTAAGAALATAD